MFLERFDEQKVPEKGVLHLEAVVTGNPTPEITWFRNNEPVEPRQNVKKTFDGKNILLEITSADSEIDSGDYKCVAINSVGRASHGARVTVDVDKVLVSGCCTGKSKIVVVIYELINLFQIVQEESRETLRGR